MFSSRQSDFSAFTFSGRRLVVVERLVQINEFPEKNGPGAAKLLPQFGSPGPVEAEASLTRNHEAEMKAAGGPPTLQPPAVV